MRDANGKTYYSFSLDKSGCVTQLPCVFGSALRDDGSSADAAYCCAAAPARSPPVSSLTMHKRLMHASPRAIADTIAHTQGSELTDDPLKLTTPIDEASLRDKGHRGCAPLSALSARRRRSPISRTSSAASATSPALPTWA